PLASVRFHYNDPTESMLDRVQEVVARYEVTTDASVVAEHLNAKTQTIAVVQDAAKATIFAAQKVNSGDMVAADRELEKQELRLRDAARKSKDMVEQQRAVTAANQVAKARSTVKAAAAAPAPAKRAAVLQMNADG